MVEVGDPAPDFTAPLANGDIVPFTLSEHLDEAPLVLAFFPGAFTSVCTTELCTFEERMGVFEDMGATVYGISVDSPFALNEFREQEDLGFGLVSDHQKVVIDRYDVRDSFDDLGYYGLAQRSVFVVDDDGTITYKWTAEHPGQEPDYEAVEAAAEETA
ncbi:peroxiredoxin [Halobacteriales archaeon QS_1_68_20]|nr:MAG: peroxiredoxin [Halobacteriales archaeon QS_1_68_20]